MSTERDAIEKQVGEELGFHVVNPKVAGIGHVPEFVEGDGESDTDYIADGRHWALFDALVAARLKLAEVERERNHLLLLPQNERACITPDAPCATLEDASLKLAAADRLADKVRAKIDNCPACRGTGQTELTRYDSASNAMEWAGFEDCRKCSALRSALLEYSRTKSLRR